MITSVKRSLIASLSVIAALGTIHGASARGQPTAPTEHKGLPETQAEGELDAPPDGPSHDPAPAQALARQAFSEIAKYIQNVEARGLVGAGYDRTPGRFYTRSHYGGWPGLCEASVIFVEHGPDEIIRSEKRYLVVGSFISPSENNASINYKAAIEANCTARRANGGWFKVGPLDFSNGATSRDGALLFDGVIAASRLKDALPFKLNCDPQFVPDTSFCSDPRKSLAGLDPKDIDNISIEDKVYNGIWHRVAVIETHGEPFVHVEIRQTSPSKNGGRIIWSISGVDMYQQSQPVY